MYVSSSFWCFNVQKITPLTVSKKMIFNGTWGEMS